MDMSQVLNNIAKELHQISLNTNKGPVDFNSLISALLGAAVGGFFSWLSASISTKRSIKAQNDVFTKNKEQFEREKAYNEKQIIKENSLIVYYDLLLGLNDIKKLYLGFVFTDLLTNVPRRMYFSDNWIKNVALASRDIRIESNVNLIYQIYGELLVIRDLLTESDLFHRSFKSNLSEIVKTFVAKYFDETNFIKVVEKDTHFVNSPSEDIATKWNIVKSEDIICESNPNDKRTIKTILKPDIENVLSVLKSLSQEKVN